MKRPRADVAAIGTRGRGAAALAERLKRLSYEAMWCASPALFKLPFIPFDRARGGFPEGAVGFGG